MKKLLSGNEALALGAYHAGVRVAAAYPGTPSTEILEAMAAYPDLHAEWSTNEKVAMEVGLGASYAGVRVLVSMKHVGLNVASDPFMAAATTGVVGGLVVISADDPGMHSSQNEQDNRYYAKLAQVPLLEPSDSQEAYELMLEAYRLSEQYDTPVLLRSTTRLSHAKTILTTERERPVDLPAAKFMPNAPKFVMLPSFARQRHPLRLLGMEHLARFAESFPYNRIVEGATELGVIASGIAFQYAREAFEGASFLKLGMTYPLPERLIRAFAARVTTLVVVEELEPFLEEQIKAMGIQVRGKQSIPRTGELGVDIIRQSAITAGWVEDPNAGLEDRRASFFKPSLPPRPPLLCPGCPHTGLFFTLGSLGLRKAQENGQPGLVITGDIGCYTLAASPPLKAMDTCACMGAGIGQAQGMAWAGLGQKIISVIGDSTFMHSGITSLVNAVYNKSNITVISLDNSTPAMTGHQPHPAVGITAQGQAGQAVPLQELVRGIGVTDLRLVDAFDLKALRAAVKSAVESPVLSVVIVRGPCAVLTHRHDAMRFVDEAKCDNCGACLKFGCQAVQKRGGEITIEPGLCIGCSLCQQVCARGAIMVKEK
jgi:indolepyruvate ferredoxin oxidoreductase, alpha subunit